MNVKKKRKVGLLLFLSVVLVLVAACGSGTSEGINGTNENGNSMVQSQSANEQKGNQETFNLTYNIAFPPAKYEDEPKNIAVEKFAKAIEEKTNGRVKIKIFYSNGLAPPDQAADALKSETINMQSASVYWSDRIPTQDFLYLPYAFYGENYMRHVLRETEIGKISDKYLEDYGIKVLMYAPAGIGGIISKEPITKFEDIRGKKFHMTSGGWLEWYKEMGLAPVKVATVEIYEAIMRGTADGAILPMYFFDTYKLHEIAKHFTVPPSNNPVPMASYMSLKTWNRLPPDIQQIIMDVAMELEQEAFEASKKATERTLEFAKEHNVTVHYLTQEDYEKFRQAAQASWDAFAAKNEDTNRMIEILKQDHEEYIRQNPEAQEWAKQWLKP